MRFNVKFAVAAALAAIAFAACSSSSKPASSTTTPTEAPTTTAPAATGSSGASGATTAYTVATATKSVKGSQQKILVDSKGMTLYVDENDKPGAPNCTGACLQAWPPLKATGTITVAPGLTLSKYTTVTASDGTKQVAVNGSPLYTWMNDTKAGDTTGQDVNGFYVVMASGTKYDPS